jgi:L-ascorbate metabolism protein UlaG (beta-lactamase superfamily)
MVFEYKETKLYWLGHDCFRIEFKGLKIYIDPFKIDGGNADLVLITHDHFDHCSPEDLRKLKGDFEVVAPLLCKEKLKGFQVKLVKPNEEVEVKGVKIKAIPAYNINKFREPGKVFHPKEAGYVGYVLHLGKISIYHAGDTDFIPEMKGLKVDVALLPVSGTYVMTVDEAVEAAKNIEAKVAIPMHYGSIVGSKKDAEEFVKRVKNGNIVSMES